MSSAARNPPSPEEVLAFVRSSRRGPLKPKEIARGLGVGNDEYRSLRRLLTSMVQEGTLYRIKGNRFAVPGKISLAVGRLQVIRSGDGFVTSTEGGEDVFVPGGLMDSAMDGDRVVVRIEGRSRRRQPTGRVIRILERAHPTVVGTYFRSRRYGYVIPRNPRIRRDVFIPPGDEEGAGEGDVVVVAITAYGDGKLGPVGRVEHVLGGARDPGVDVLSILHEHGLPAEFPREVIAAARESAKRASEVWEGSRVDCRDLHVITIDPADAKDHDDALSVRPAEPGLWDVGIHIADVSHFVEPGGALDVEALNRGTSAYLVDRVVPMLPEVLSSDVCSLAPGEDRLTVSLFVRLDESATVVEHRFARAVIRSRHKLSYEQAEEVLAGRHSIDPLTDESLRVLGLLADVLHRDRAGRGSLDFDLPEARVELGPEGEPLDIQRILRLRSHRLIEEFMLLANEIVAQEGRRRRLPLLYRVHEPPPADRVRNLRRFLAPLGHKLPHSGLRPADLQKVLQGVSGRPEENLVSAVILRSLSRARYAAENLGHFGLALASYAHFTSPIRRYPDLTVHRAVVQFLIEGRPVSGGTPEGLSSVADHCSLREQIAAEAERDSVELKKVEFMERHLGDEFTGTVSGVTAFGLFVLLDDYFVEGLIHVRALEDDYYHFVETEYSLVGDRSGRRYRLGDRLSVRVARVDREERRIDFVLLGRGSPGV